MSSDVSQPAPYVHYHGFIDHDYVTSLMRFRTGGHNLRVTTGRWENGSGIPREQRICQLCTERQVEDERHALLECPRYDDIRARFNDVYNGREGDMLALMCHPSQHRVAQLVYMIMKCRGDGHQDMGMVRLFANDSHLDPFDSDDDVVDIVHPLVGDVVDGSDAHV